MAIAHSRFVDQDRLQREVIKAIPKLGKEAVRVRHSIGTDSSGDPSIFFRIVLADEATQEDTLADVTGRIVDILFHEIRPYENWGLIPYFSFRGNSEQAKRKEPEWS